MIDEVDYLENWTILNKYVQTLDEDTLWKLLQREQKEQARTQFLIRLYGRYNRLRTIRERREMLAKPVKEESNESRPSHRRRFRNTRHRKPSSVPA